MKIKYSIFLLAAGLAASSASAGPETSGELHTVTVNGRSYDVFYDPYATDYAIIFGKRSILVEALPKAEIIAQATPCEFDKKSTITFQHSEMIHPTRPELENLGWVPLDCSES